MTASKSQHPVRYIWRIVSSRFECGGDLVRISGPQKQMAHPSAPLSYPTADPQLMGCAITSELVLDRTANGQIFRLIFNRALRFRLFVFGHAVKQL